MDSAGTRTGARPALALSGLLFLLFTLLLWPLHYLTTTRTGIEAPYSFHGYNCGTVLAPKSTTAPSSGMPTRTCFGSPRRQSQENRHSCRCAPPP